MENIRNIRKISLWLIVLALFSTLYLGCVNSIDYPLPESPPQVVVNALLSPELPITVQVSLSATALALDIPTVADAEVGLYVADTLYARLLHVGNGQYQPADTLYPAPGLAYQVRVSVPEVGTVQSSYESLPPEPAFEALELSAFHYTPTRHRLALTLPTSAGMPQYYQMELYATDGERIGAGLDPKSSHPPNCCHDYYYELFTHPATTNEPWQIAWRVSTRQLGPSDTVVVQLSRLSAAYFQHLLDPSYGTSEIDVIFSTPDEPFSNIEGGYGILATRQVATFRLPVSP